MISPYAFPGIKHYRHKKLDDVKFNKCKVTPEMVLEVVSKNCGVTVEDILSQVRSRTFVDARHYFCAIMRKQLDYPVTAIGKLMNRDHTTVVHATQKFYDRCETDENYKRVYDSIIFDIWTRI